MSESQKVTSMVAPMEYPCDRPGCQANAPLPNGIATTFRTTQPDKTFTLYCSTRCQRLEHPVEEQPSLPMDLPLK